jgi:hypothetical protein
MSDRIPNPDYEMHDEHLTEGELAGFLDDALDDATRDRVERHLDGCDECRAELIAVTSLLETAAAGSGSARGQRRWKLRGAVAALSAAAAIVLIVLIPQIEPSGGTIVDRERVGTEEPALLSAYEPPDEATLSASGLTFAWADYGSDSYRVTVTTEDGGLVWSLLTADTVAQAPTTVGFDPGATYFWYVDAIEGGIIGRSAVRSFTVTH